MNVLFKVLVAFFLLILTVVGLSYILVRFFYYENTVLVCVDLSLLIFTVLLIKLWKPNFYIKKLICFRIFKIITLGILIMLLYPILNIPLFIKNIQSSLIGTMKPILEIISNENFTFSNGYYIIKMIVFAPILEEVFFRGIIQISLRKQYSMWVSILLSSLLFGLWHMNLEQLIVTFIFGVLVGFLYEKSKNLLEVILLHIIINIGAAFFKIQYKILEIQSLIYFLILATLAFLIIWKITTSKKKYKI